jgi:hypothetical protein
MVQGFRQRRRAPFLTGAIFMAAFPLSQAGPGGDRAAASPGGQGPWWEVRLSVETRGTYAVHGDGPAVKGEYTLRARWEGRLEPDAEDFLLVRLKTELLEWRLRESSGPSGREAVREAPSSPQPVLRLVYVLKDGHDVEFAFEFDGLDVPLRPSSVSIPLELPRSAGRAYGDFVHNGSNRVVVPESDLADKARERRFSWEWQSDEQIIRKGRVYFVAQAHTAEASVVLTSH